MQSKCYVNSSLLSGRLRIQSVQHRPLRARSNLSMAMKTTTIPVWSDNYAYLITDGQGACAAVDPVDGDKVLQTAAEHGLDVSMVLTTHAHSDHDGGNATLAGKIQNLKIIGGEGEGVAACTQTVKHNEELQLGNIKIKCLHTPFHTKGHMCYLCTDTTDPNQAPALFTGDSLFIGGCGRNLVGDYGQMYAALMDVLAKQPQNAQIYCGHEYTVKNLEFLQSIDRNNPALQIKLAWAKEQRLKGAPTVPSILQEELQYNAFLRCDQPGVRGLMGAPDDPVGALKEWRDRKDSYGWDAWLVTKAFNLYKSVWGT